MTRLRIGHGETDTLPISRSLEASGALSPCFLHHRRPDITEEDLSFVLEFCCCDGQDCFELELDQV